MKKVFSILFLCFVIVNNIFAVDTLQVKQIYDGVKYYHFTTDEPLSIFLLEIDLSKKIKFELGYANNAIGKAGEPLSQMSSRMVKDGYKVIAGVNSDFFGGDPYVAENSMVKAGNVFKGVNINRNLIGFDCNNQPMISAFNFNGYIQTEENKIKIDQMNANSDTDKVFIFDRNYSINVELKDNQSAFIIKPVNNTTNYGINEYTIVKIFNGDLPKFLFLNRSLIVLPSEYIKMYNLYEGKQIHINLSFEPSINNLYTLIGGLPHIMENGKPIDNFDGREGLHSEKFFGKNPRTAIGFNKKENKAFIIAVDGRRDDYSVGMTMKELSYYMYSLGCEDALNFDGGGSTTMVIRDSVLNKPTDLIGERAVFNGLFICMDDSLNNVVDNIKIVADKNSMAIDDSIKIDVFAVDNWGYKIDVPIDLINFTWSELIVYLKNDYFYPLNRRGYAKVTWYFNNLQGEFGIFVDK